MVVPQVQRFQLERAWEDDQSAEDQLKSVEEYMSSIIHAIGCLGFMVGRNLHSLCLQPFEKSMTLACIVYIM